MKYLCILLFLTSCTQKSDCCWTKNEYIECDWFDDNGVNMHSVDPRITMKNNLRYINKYPNCEDNQ